jgi:hypothetical protein
LTETCSNSGLASNWMARLVVESTIVRGVVVRDPGAVSAGSWGCRRGGAAF